MPSAPQTAYAERPNQRQESVLNALQVLDLVKSSYLFEQVVYVSLQNTAFEFVKIEPDGRLVPYSQLTEGNS